MKSGRDDCEPEVILLDSFSLFAAGRTESHTKDTKITTAGEDLFEKTTVFVLFCQDARLALNQPRILYRNRCSETDVWLLDWPQLQSRVQDVSEAVLGDA